MPYKEATANLQNSPLVEPAKSLFCYQFANLCDVAVKINSGAIVEEDTPENYYAVAYFMGWKWRQDMLIMVAKDQGYPPTEFVEFVNDMVTKLGIAPEGLSTILEASSPRITSLSLENK